MDLWQSLLLGLVEGLTEFLPVSSTGHLILAQRAAGIPEGEAADAYAVCIQAGAILAVLVLYAGRVRDVALGLLGRCPAGLRLAFHIAVAFLPAAIIGAVVGRHVKEALFHLPAIAVAWAAGGLGILAIGYFRRGRLADGMGLEDLTWRRALVIGLIQCASFWPGTSRSLVTLLGGLLVGLSLPAAVEFTFLLGVVTLLAATAKDAWSSGALMVESYGWASLVLGFLVAGLSAAASIKWMVAYLNRHSLAVFGWYRLALAAIVVGLLIAEIL